MDRSRELITPTLLAAQPDLPDHIARLEDERGELPEHVAEMVKPPPVRSPSSPEHDGPDPVLWP